MELVARRIGESAMNDRRIGWAVRIAVNGRQIVAVRFVQIRLNGDDVEELLSFTVFHCVQWRRMPGPVLTACADGNSDWRKRTSKKELSAEL